MNIFHVLSQGKARLHEPSMSAMLGYLLDSSKDHGLSDSVIRKLLESFDKDDKRFSDILGKPFINSQVELEAPYELAGGGKRAIDIDIGIQEGSDRESKIIHRIIIENKIRESAANPNQLKEYYQAIMRERPEEKITIVFLTPNTPNTRKSKLTAEFNNLILEKNEHKKYWIKWSSDEESISGMLQTILELEVSGKIHPINEYMRHTLKAFIQHSLTTEKSDRKTTRAGEDIGDVIDNATVKTKSGEYEVIRRNSHQIQVFDLETGNKEIARRVLAQYIDENDLGIKHEELNTRMIGRKFFEWKNKNSQS